MQARVDGVPTSALELVSGRGCAGDQELVHRVVSWVEVEEEMRVEMEEEMEEEMRVVN